VANPTLKKYLLTDKQWELAKTLAEILMVSCVACCSERTYEKSKFQIFDDITNLFSCADVPLVHEVVPMLMLLQEQLEHVHDAPDLPKVIHIVAIAGLLVVKKYSKLSKFSEVYWIAMGTYFAFLKYSLSFCAAVMCPDKKLTWFDNEQVAAVEQLVRQRWLDTYKKLPPVDISSNPDGSPVKVHSSRLCHLILLTQNSVTLKVAF